MATTLDTLSLSDCDPPCVVDRGLAGKEIVVTSWWWWQAFGWFASAAATSGTPLLHAKFVLGGEETDPVWHGVKPGVERDAAVTS